MRKWWDDLKLMHLRVGVFWWESHWLVNSSKWEELHQELMWHNDDIREKPKDFPRGYKKAKWVARSTRTTHIMASEVFLAVFCVWFDAHYDASNESCLRWWINESIWDFIAAHFHMTEMCYRCVQCGTRDTAPRYYYGLWKNSSISPMT